MDEPSEKNGRTRSLAERERAALAHALLEAGPDADTLCEGWTTRDLARHLVLREGNPEAVARFAAAKIPALRGRLPGTDARPRAFEDVVEQFRSGPARAARGSPVYDVVVNTAEHYVDHEDVRRAVPGWEPRDLPVEDEKALWGPTQFMARRSYLRCPVGVVLVVPDGPRSKVRRGVPGGGGHREGVRARRLRDRPARARAGRAVRPGRRRARVRGVALPLRHRRCRWVRRQRTG